MKKMNKKPLLAIALVAVIGIVGGTFAYYVSSNTFTNEFLTKKYKTEVEETFTSPSDWTPGTTTSKTVIAKNTGDTNAVVRVSYTENWEDSNGNKLSLKDSSNNSAAIINFADDISTKWTKSTENGVDYYYYNEVLSPNTSSTSFIKSVTFNKDFDLGNTSSCTPKTDGTGTTCTNTTNGYAGGKYTLTIKVETAQADQYKNIWSTSVKIGK
jgi:alternate signal-mediated exported protein